MIRRAMVLAAGRGTRLAPLTDRMPKPMAPVAGRPMLDWVLDFLRAGGIEDVVINLHHLGHVIEEHVGDGRHHGLSVRYSREPEILDTGGGIKRAEPLLGGEPFVVVNGDSLLDLALADVVAFHERRGGLATLAVRADPDAARYGLVELDGDDRVRRIAGRPEGGGDQPLRAFMFPGLHVLDPAVFAWMEPDGPFGIVRVTYPRLIEAGVPVFGWETPARWINIDDPDALAAASVEMARAPFRFAQ
jgi:NDP-sugar pyrophosphorylase family protein